MSNWQSAANFYSNTSDLDKEYKRKSLRRGNALGMLSEGLQYAEELHQDQEDLSEMIKFAGQYSDSSETHSINYDEKSKSFTISSLDDPSVGGVITPAQFKESIPYLKFNFVNPNQLLKFSDPIPDTEVRKIEGEDVSVNVFEADLIDQGHADVVAPYMKKDAYGNWTAQSSIMDILNMASVAKTGASALGVTGAIGAAAPWLGAGLVAYDWIKGAADKAELARNKIDKIEEGIGVLKSKSADAIKDFSDFTSEAYEDVERTFKNFGTKVGDTLLSAQSGFNKIIKGGKGLKTGMVDVNKDAIQTSIENQTSQLSESVFDKLDDSLKVKGKATQNTLEDINYQIKNMENEVSFLEGEDKWYKNLLG